MVILGVDPGSVRTGWGVIETDGRRHHLVDMGVVAPSPRLDLPRRLHQIHAGVSALLDRHHPQVLAVEDCFHHLNTRTALVLGHVRGAVLLAGAQAGLDVREYPPATVKARVAGTGRAEKAQVAFMVSRTLELAGDIEPGDATDALAVALCCATDLAAQDLIRRVSRVGAARTVIAHLTGRLLRKAPQEVVVDVSGVGYRVAIPVSTFYRLGEPGEPISLRVHTHVREDALLLFGFLAAHEQDLFEQLITVSGVGPKLALNILSGIESAELASALRRRDLVRLTRIPGVGKKTAERLIVELQDKVADLAAPEAEVAAASSAKDDLVSALVHLGYGRPDAEREAERALAASPAARFEDILRAALQHMARR